MEWKWLTRRNIILIAVAICIVALIARSSGRQSAEDVRAGVAFLDERESGDVAAVKAEIQKIEQQQKTTTLNRVLEEIASGERDLWEQFGDVFLVGDSRVAPFLSYEFLTEKHVYAGESQNLKTASDGVDQARRLNPSHIVFAFGLDDALGVWTNKEEFIEQYEAVIRLYQRAVPDADIFLCSIASPLEEAEESLPKVRNIPSFNSEITSLCKRNRYVRIDCERLFTDHADLYAQDGVHFKNDMYPIWGQLILEAVLRSESSVAS